MNKEELKKEIIKKYSKHKSIFMPHKDDILYLKQNNVTLKGILEYLFQIDENIKNKYQGKEKTAIANLSLFIKKWQINQNKNTIKPKSKLKENKKDITINEDPLELLKESKSYIIDEELRKLV